MVSIQSDNMYLLGIDLGSSSVKVAMVNAATQECVVVTQQPKTEMKIDAPQEGWAEQNPEDWWSNFKMALKTLLIESKVKPDQIIGIGISYQMHGLVIVDEDQKVLRPSIIWCDSRASEIGEKAFEQIGSTKCLTHYLNSPGNFTASKLKWVKENEPSTYKLISKMMLPGDYLAMKMTGQIQTTISGLSEGILWDFKQGNLALELLEEYGISEKLIPDIVPTFSKQAVLSKEAADELGLKEGTPIGYRAGDQPNNAFSLGVIHPNEVAATGGTSGVVYGIVDQAKNDKKSRVNGFAHVNHTNEHPRIGTLLCINGAGSLYAWIKKHFAHVDSSYKDMEIEASKIPIGSEGLCILPFGNGSERMLENHYKGAQVNNLQFSVHSQAHFFRAALEGIAFSFVYGLELLKNMGIDPNIIRVGNDNLFQSDIFSNTLATLSGVEIAMIETTGAIGAAKAAGYGIGTYTSMEEAVGKHEIIKNYSPTNHKEQYKTAYQNWRRILEKQYKI